MVVKRDRKEYMKEYHKKYFKENREKLLQDMKEYHKENKEKIKLRKNKHRIENNKEILIKEKEKYQQDPKLRLKKIARSIAIKVPLKSSCQICGDKQNLERHHWRYDKPLMVATLCRDCHKIQHIKHFDGGINFGK
jgi:Na+-translocating ferredoxin:NAD+ oxidoreductase RnfC subunit